MEFRFHAAEQQRWREVRELLRAKEARQVIGNNKLRVPAPPARNTSPSGECGRAAPGQLA